MVEGYKPKNSQNGIYSFFHDLDCTILKEIDEFNKIIRFTFKRKQSEDYIQSSQKENVSLVNQVKIDQGQPYHSMLVNYQVSDVNNEKDKAWISMFEYNEEKQAINPNNFVILSQKISPGVSNSMSS